MYLKKRKRALQTQRGIVPVSGRRSMRCAHRLPAAREKGENTYAEKH
jgi:hypothetical protein